MMNSNVMRYALLAVSVNKQNHLFQSNYLAGLVALGLYELEECGSHLEWGALRAGAASTGGTGVSGRAVPVHRRSGRPVYAGAAGDDAQAGRPGIL